eukprot:1137828-Pelagomonas_calceolata.AAC.13
MTSCRCSFACGGGGGCDDCDDGAHRCPPCVCAQGGCGGECGGGWGWSCRGACGSAVRVAHAP